MQGLKHLVQCHCILPQYRKMKDPVFHKFVVFSTIDNNDNVEPKNVQCNNCGVIHKVFDICKSEILHSKEDLKTLISKKDIQMMLPNKLSEILDSYDVDLPTWEQAHFIIKNKLWNSQILISRDETDYEETGKVLKIINLNDFVIDVQTTQKYIGDFENE
jgi:hypothetical protein|tara:strand:+ start:7056 stop:7535 length:480 start_codon:yes stop_codon:yes gene_type:complete